MIIIFTESEIMPIHLDKSIEELYIHHLQGYNNYVNARAEMILLIKGDKFKVLKCRSDEQGQIRETAALYRFIADYNGSRRIFYGP